MTPPETQDGKWPKAGFLSSETVRVGYRVLDAQYFAVAQRRRRVFLIAVPCELVEGSGERACPSEILSLRESVFGNPPTRGATGQGTAAGFAGCSGGGIAKPLGSHALSKGRGSDLDNTTYVAFHPTQDPISSEDGVSHALGTGLKGGCATAAVAFTKSKRAQSNTDDETWVPGEVSPTMSCFDQGDTRATTVVAFKPSHYTRGKDGAPSDVTAPLSADADKGDQDTVVAFQSSLGSRGGDVYQDGSATTVRVGSGIGIPSPPAVATAMAVRRLTPRECERLQGFPDGYTLVEYRNKPAADGPRYRALGNSMAVPCMWWLGYRLSLATGQRIQEHP